MISCIEMYRRIEKRCDEKGMSVPELAALAKVNMAILDNLKAGVKGVSMSSIVPICRVLDCTVSDLLKKDEPSRDAGVYLEDPEWRQKFYDKMAVNAITLEDLGAEMDAHPNYIRAVLDGKAQMPYAEKRFRSAMTRIKLNRENANTPPVPKIEQKTEHIDEIEKESETQMTGKLNMTLHECRQELNALGVQVSPQMLSDGIEQGIFPFGHVLRTGSSGRRTFIIFRKDFSEWVKTMSVEEAQ